jgi:ClpP class serine protease
VYLKRYTAFLRFKRERRAVTKAFQACCGVPWHITRDGISLILSIAMREHGSIEAVEARLGRKLENTRTVTERNGVAIVPVTGPIFRYANLFSDISGATSIQVLARDFTAALNDPNVQTILLNIDSPGGEANGIAEFAEMVYAARGKKKVVGYVGGYGASAAYWIASACSEIVMNESAIVGSIGTIAAIPDPAVEHAGEVVFVSSQSPRKHADPTTEAGAADIQALLDALTDVFVTAVARNRAVSVETVLTSFGQGGLFVGQQGVVAGLADRLGSFEGVLAELSGRAVEAAADPPQAKATAPIVYPAAAATITREAEHGFVHLTVPALAAGPLPSLTVGVTPTASLPRGEVRRPSVKETIAMSEPTQEAPPVAPPLPPPPAVQDAAMQSRLDTYMAEMEARNQAMQEAAFARAQSEFERRIQALEQRRTIESFAQARTVTSVGQPWAVPGTAEELAALLTETPAGVRSKWMSLLTRITQSGLLSFDEIGSSAEGAAQADQWTAIVNAKVAAGKSKVQAIQEAAREHPDLYAAQTRAKKGGR